MTSAAVLLLMAGASEVATPPRITIDSCIAVDADEVRRLTAVELSDWVGRTPLDALEVTVTCEDGIQNLRVIDRARDRTTARAIDLGSSQDGEAYAPAQELALAIAELLRRADAEPLPPPSAPVRTLPAMQPALVPARPTSRVTEVRPWRVEVGFSVLGAAWTSGATLFGGDLTGRLRLSRWILGDLRLGARRTRPVEVDEDRVDGHGVGGGAGLAFDATPFIHGAGVSFGARLGVDWLRYRAVNEPGTATAGGDAIAVSAAGTTTAFVLLFSPLCLVIDVAVGGALHSVAVRKNDDVIAVESGVLLSTSVGLGGQF